MIIKNTSTAGRVSLEEKKKAEDTSVSPWTTFDSRVATEEIKVVPSGQENYGFLYRALKGTLYRFN